MDDYGIYKSFMRYGEILKCDEYFVYGSNSYITIKLAKLDDDVALFILENAKLKEWHFVKEMD